jgi:hypothetical protein
LAASGGEVERGFATCVLCVDIDGVSTVLAEQCTDVIKAACRGVV